PHPLEGRSHPPHAPARDDAGEGHRLCRGGGAGRGDAEVDPPAQEAARPARPQARLPRRRGGRRVRPGAPLAVIASGTAPHPTLPLKGGGYAIPTPAKKPPPPLWERLGGGQSRTHLP